MTDKKNQFDSLVAEVNDMYHDQTFGQVSNAVLLWYSVNPLILSEWLHFVFQGYCSDDREIPGRRFRALPPCLLREPAHASHRPVRRPRRGHGQVVLSKVHGRLHPQVIQAPPHRRRLLRNG